MVIKNLFLFLIFGFMFELRVRVLVVSSKISNLFKDPILRLFWWAAVIRLDVSSDVGVPVVSTEFHIFYSHFVLMVSQ